MMTESSEQLTEAVKEASEPTLYDLFIMKHLDRVNMWIKAHKEHHKLPITYDELNGFRWLNRKSRRSR